jgi:hypothetical protein
MVDNQTAQLRCGNIFNYVLIASERVRELHAQRREDGLLRMTTEQYSKLPTYHKQVSEEIATGVVGLEYLDKIRERARIAKERGKRDMRKY